MAVAAQAREVNPDFGIVVIAAPCTPGHLFVIVPQRAIVVTIPEARVLCSKLQTYLNTHRSPSA